MKEIRSFHDLDEGAQRRSFSEAIDTQGARRIRKHRAVDVVDLIGDVAGLADVPHDS